MSPAQHANPANEVESMACVLEGQHGPFAAGIADFFATYHSLGGDDIRSDIWVRVADSIRDREQARIEQV